MARRRFFADACDGSRAEVRGARARHLAQVLRAQPGQAYELVWQGRVFAARVQTATADRVVFACEEEVATPAPGPRLTVAAALFKFDRFEWMLEKATELGASGIAPVISRRTDPHLASAAAKRLQRWHTLVAGAAEQSRRCDVPEIAPPQPLAEFLGAIPPGQRMLLAEAGGGMAMPAAPAEGLVVLAGPEGGWSPEEVEAAEAAGFTPVSLGPRILRCETAILAALARAAV